MDLVSKNVYFSSLPIPAWVPTPLSPMALPKDPLPTRIPEAPHIPVPIRD